MREKVWKMGKPMAEVVEKVLDLTTGWRSRRLWTVGEVCRELGGVNGGVDYPDVDDAMQCLLAEDVVERRFVERGRPQWAYRITLERWTLFHPDAPATQAAEQARLDRPGKLAAERHEAAKAKARNWWSND